MVGHLVLLKWRYVIASLKRSVWAVIGLSLGCLHLIGMLIGLGVLYIFLSTDTELGGPSLAIFLGALVTLGWMLAPVFVSGLDGTLDESRFVLFPIDSKTLQKGQLLGGFIGLPGTATVVMVLLGTLGYLSNPLAAVLYIPCALIGLVTLMCLARLGNKLGVYLNANPRINTVLLIMAGVLLMSSGFIVTGTVAYVMKHFDQLVPYLSWLGYTPFGAAFAAPLNVAAGNWGQAALCLLLALVYAVAAWFLWGYLLGKSMRNVNAQKNQGRAKALISGNIGVFAKFPATPAGAVVARTVHSYLKDPRLSVSAVMCAMMFVVMGILAPMFSNGMLTHFGAYSIQVGAAANTAGVDAIFNFWVYFASILTGYYMMYSVSYDSTAFSLHVLAPLRGRDDRLGRALGYSMLMVPVVLVMTLVICIINGHIELYPAALMHQLGAYAAAVGVSLFADTFISVPAPPPGANPFKNSKQSDGIAKQLLVIVNMLVCMVFSLPAFICVAIYMFGSHNVMMLWLGGILQLAIGVTVVALGIVFGGKSYDRRSSAMLQRVARFAK